jgi:hypothetical protein
MLQLVEYKKDTPRKRSFREESFKVTDVGFLANISSADDDKQNKQHNY